MERYLAVVLGRRWLVIVVVSLVMLLMTAGARHVTVSDDLRIMLSRDNPQLIAFDALEDTYSTSNSVLIAIAPREGSVFTRETLRAIRRIDRRGMAGRLIPAGSTPSPTIRTARQSKTIWSWNRLSTTRRRSAMPAWHESRRLALNAADLAGRLVSHDGRVSGLAINFVMPEPRGNAVFEATDYLHAMLDEARTRHPDIAYYLTGNVVLNRVIADETEYNMGVLAPIAFIVVVIGAAILLRSALSTLVVVFVIIFAINTTLGFAGWLGLVLSPTTAALPVVVMVLAVAHSVHIVATALSNMRHGNGQESGDCGLSAREFLAGVPHLGHDRGSGFSA